VNGETAKQFTAENAENAENGADWGKATANGTGFNPGAPGLRTQRGIGEGFECGWSADEFILTPLAAR